MLIDVMLAKCDAGINRTDTQNIQTSDLTNYLSEWENRRTERPNCPQARRLRSNCFGDTGDPRKSHYSDSSFDRFVLLPDFNCRQLLSCLQAEQFWIINSISSHLHILCCAAESTPATAVSSGEGPRSSWADGRDSESRGTCCSGSLLMFSRFLFFFHHYLRVHTIHYWLMKRYSRRSISYLDHEGSDISSAQCNSFIRSIY